MAAADDVTGALESAMDVTATMSPLADGVYPSSVLNAVEAVAEAASYEAVVEGSNWMTPEPLGMGADTDPISVGRSALVEIDVTSTSAGSPLCDALAVIEASADAKVADGESLCSSAELAGLLLLVGTSSILVEVEVGGLFTAGELVGRFGSKKEVDG